MAITGDGANYRDVQKNPVQNSLPTFLVGKLGDAADPVNDATFSGKQLGSVVVGLVSPTEAALYVAQGADTTDTWVKQTDGLAITPA